jgi:hypothetical protein
MSTTSRPATPDQVRLLIGLSSLMVLPMLAVVMVYFTGHQTAPLQAPSWRAFVFALVVGAATVGLVLVRFAPLFGGTPPTRAPARIAVQFAPLFGLFLIVVIGRLVHQAVPVTTGFIAGVDAVLATVLLIRSLRAMRITTGQPQ